MSEPSSPPRKNLGVRSAEFARDVRLWVRKLPTDPIMMEDVKQLVRSSGSVAANYVEANESLGKKDCGMRMKICRKEAKESRLWLSMLDLVLPPELHVERLRLMQEADELVRIFHTIIEKYYS